MIFLFLIYSHTEYCGVAANHFVNMWFYGYDYKNPDKTTISWKSEFELDLKNKVTKRRDNKEPYKNKAGNDPGYMHRKIGFLIECLGVEWFLLTYYCSRESVIHKDATKLWSYIPYLQIYEDPIAPPIVLDLDKLKKAYKIKKDKSDEADHKPHIQVVNNQVLLDGYNLFKDNPIESSWNQWDSIHKLNNRPLRIRLNEKDIVERPTARTRTTLKRNRRAKKENSSDEELEQSDVESGLSDDDEWEPIRKKSTPTRAMTLKRKQDDKWTLKTAYENKNDLSLSLAFVEEAMFKKEGQSIT